MNKGTHCERAKKKKRKEKANKWEKWINDQPELKGKLKHQKEDKLKHQTSQ